MHDKLTGCDTKTLITATIYYPDNCEARVERLRVEASGQERIRFTWWEDGKLVHAPLDLQEDEFFAILTMAVSKGVFSAGFIEQLRELVTHCE